MSMWGEDLSGCCESWLAGRRRSLSPMRHGVGGRVRGGVAEPRQQLVIPPAVFYVAVQNKEEGKKESEWTIFLNTYQT